MLVSRIDILSILILFIISSNEIIPAGLTLCYSRKKISNIMMYIKYEVNGFLRDIFIARKDDSRYNKSSLYIESLRK